MLLLFRPSTGGAPPATAVPVFAYHYDADEDDEVAAFLKQSTNVTVLIGPFIDKTDGVTEETGLAGAGTEISKAGAAFGAGPVLGTHDADGWYPIALTTTHTNTLGILQVKVHDNATHLPVRCKFMVLPAMMYDSIVAGTDRLDTNVTHVADQSQTARDLGATLGVAGAGLTAVPWNASWDAEVQSEVEDGLVVHRLDELLNADSDIDGAAPPTVGSVFHELMSKSTGSFTFDQTTDSLEAARDNIGTTGGAIVLAKTTNITGFNDLSAAQVNAEVDTALDTAIPGVPTAGSINDVIRDLDARLPGSGTISTLTAAAVNTEVVDALATDTYAEPGQEAPGATVPLSTKIGYLYKAFRNKKDQTSTTFRLYADDTTTVDQKATVSDDGSTFVSGEIGTGP